MGYICPEHRGKLNPAFGGCATLHIDYEAESRAMRDDIDSTTAEWRRIKASLTRAERTGDASKILAACDEAERVFDSIGWPDWWSRIERMRRDAGVIG